MATTVDVEIMLFEAGIIANGLTSSTAGTALSDRLCKETEAALADEKASLTFTFSAYEAGLAYSAVEKLSGSEATDLSDRVLQAVRMVMQEIGAIPEGSVSQNGSAQSPDAAASEDQSAPAPEAQDEPAAEPAQEPEPSAQPSDS